jgi:hypothetical protein
VNIYLIISSYFNKFQEKPLRLPKKTGRDLPLFERR